MFKSFYNRSFLVEAREKEAVASCSSYAAVSVEEVNTLLSECRGSDRVTRIKHVRMAQLKVGRHPHLRYVEARIKHAQGLALAMQARKKEMHAENQRAWANGGQIRRYLQNHGRFGGQHMWLRKLLTRETGLSCAGSRLAPEWGESVDGSWTVISSSVYDLEDENVAPVRSKKISWADESHPDHFEWLKASGLLSPVVVKEAVQPPVRSIMLLYKLRAMRRELRNVAYATVYGCNQAPVAKGVSPFIKVSNCERGEPEMEGLTGESPQVISTSNVVLTESNPAGETITSIPEFRFDWHQLCSTEKTLDYSDLTDRYTYFNTIQWSTENMPTNTELFLQKTQTDKDILDMPYDFVYSVAQDGSMPMFVPFRIHKYFRSDIEVKIHINSNPFQVGQLQFSWQYMEKYDGNKLNNVYSRSQLPHVLVNAGSSNEVTMYIPFKFVQPYLHTS